MDLKKDENLFMSRKLAALSSAAIQPGLAGLVDCYGFKTLEKEGKVFNWNQHRFLVGYFSAEQDQDEVENPDVIDTLEEDHMSDSPGGKEGNNGNQGKALRRGKSQNMPGGRIPTQVGRSSMGRAVAPSITTPKTNP